MEPLQQGPHLPREMMPAAWTQKAPSSSPWHPQIYPGDLVCPLLLPLQKPPGKTFSLPPSSLSPNVLAGDETELLHHHNHNSATLKPLHNHPKAAKSLQSHSSSAPRKFSLLLLLLLLLLHRRLSSHRFLKFSSLCALVPNPLCVLLSNPSLCALLSNPPLCALLSNPPLWSCRSLLLTIDHPHDPSFLPQIA